MVDRLSPERRSALMSKVRGKDTSPEMRVRRLLHSLGYRYRLHDKKLPGKPDLTFVSRRKVIFVHGCFWHRHPGCKKATTPKTRTGYWETKFENNVRRDEQVLGELEKSGWDVIVIWECETHDPHKLEHLLRQFLGKPKLEKASSHSG